MSDELVVTHKWEKFGYKAPFKFLGLIQLPNPEGNPHAVEQQYKIVAKQNKQFGVFAGSCNLCGNGLMNNFVVGDAEGTNFIVGCDCVRHLDDVKLITRVEKAEKDRKRAIRRAKAEELQKIRQAEWAAEQQAQRDRNGGLTDWEVEDKARKQAKEDKRIAMTAKNSWLIDALTRSGSFVYDMRYELQFNEIEDLSPRAVDILKDIYAKSFGRRNSKKYEAACEDFDARVAGEKITLNGNMIEVPVGQEPPVTDEKKW